MRVYGTGEEHDWSHNLPTWAYTLGYRLLGGMGTYDDLHLYKGRKLVKTWDWLSKDPSMIELEEIVRGIECNSDNTGL